MEGENSQKSTIEPRLFKIPIEEYEKDMETESAKGKKKEILNLFNNYNKLRYEEEFEEIKNRLHKACIDGDVDLIKIYMSEKIENDSNTLQFKIDSTNQTASLFSTNNGIEIIVPKTVEHESVEYLITSITLTSKNLKKLKFVEDSAVKTIYGFVFSVFSDISEIYFPASLKELKDGWCCDTDYLTKIRISPSNDQFIIIDDKYLIGKSDSNKDEFDKLLFAYRNIKEISIPSNIKIISSYAFENCKKLKKVEIQPNSNLQTIEKYAFSNSKIKEISIPSKVSKICEHAFYFCLKLIKVEIPTNSNLQTIEANAFEFSDIDEIYFPTSLKELKEGWCCNTRYLTKIRISPSNDQFKFIDDKYLIGKSDSNKDEFDNLLFVCRNIKEISIPSNIKIISSYAFEYCENVTKVEIPPNSNLQTIESFTFYGSNIKEILIPSKVSKMCEYAFHFCQNLRKVEIPTNSNLQVIEANTFSSTQIDEIYFPASLKELKDGWCCDTDYLTKIRISPSNDQFKIIDDKYLIGKSDSNKDEFDKLLFAYRNIKEISIPSNIKIISSYAFQNCINLTKVEIPPNSNLQTIEKYAFSNSKIEEISIPSNNRIISSYAFQNCTNLTKVEIPTNSNLQIIGSYAFSNSNIKEISIPSNIEIISSYAFQDCTNLTKVEIPTNSNLQTIGKYAFSNLKINQIFIPPKVSKIGKQAFSCGTNLQIIEISEESKLDSFPFSAFNYNSETIIMIPASLDKLIHLNKPI